MQPQVPLTGLPVPRPHLGMIPQPSPRVVAERFTAEALVQPGTARDIGLHYGEPRSASVRVLNVVGADCRSPEGPMNDA